MLAPALLVDAPMTATLDAPRCPRTGALVIVAPLTWCGVKPVPYRNKEYRMLRRPEQVNSDSYRRSLRGLIATHGHPYAEGRPAFVHAKAGRAELPDLGFAWVPPERVQIGYTGDEILTVEREGYQLPAARTWVTGDSTATAIERGLNQTSLGHFTLLDFTPGEFTTPDGKVERYDVEQVLDVTDPRIKEAIESGMVPPELAEMIGANHYALALMLGRGLGQSVIDRVLGAHDGLELGPAPRVFSMIRKADESGVSGTGHVLDGVVWPNGQLSICWCAGPLTGDEQTPQAFKSLAAFKTIHIDQHPDNGTELIFHDGQPAPECYAPAAEVSQHADEHTEDSTMKYLLLPKGVMIPESLRARFKLAVQADGALQLPVPDAVAADPGPVIELLTGLGEQLAQMKGQMAQMETDAAAQAQQLQAAQTQAAQADLMNKELQAQVDSLRVKAAIGDRIELEQVTADAKEFFGCSDEDLSAAKTAAETAAKGDPKKTAPAPVAVVRSAALRKILGDHPILACADSVVAQTFDWELARRKKGSSTTPTKITTPAFGAAADRRDDPVIASGPGVDPNKDDFPY